MKWNGSKHRTGQFVLVGWQEDDLPEFSKVRDLIVVENQHLLILSTYFTLGIDRHYHSYVVKSTFKELVIDVKCVCDYHPVYVHKMSNTNTLYIAMKSHSMCVH